MKPLASRFLDIGYPARLSPARCCKLALVMWCLINPVLTGHAAPPPTITKIYDAPGQIWGGLAGDGSNLYFTTLAKNTGWTFSQVVSITASGSFRWSWDNGCPLAGGNMRTVPTINPAGTRLFVAADHGKVFCPDTAVSPSQRIIWQYPPTSTFTLPVRSGIAYDAVAPKPGGGTEEAVYFQGNNGYVYSLRASDGGYRWGYDTGNLRAAHDAKPSGPLFRYAGH